MQHDYKLLDSMWQFNYKEDLDIVTKNHKCSYISECIFDLYYNQKKPVSEVSEIMGVCKYTVNLWMNRWGFAARPRGGNTRNPALKNQNIIKKIIALKGKVNSAVAAKQLGCCSSVMIRKIWEKTA